MQSELCGLYITFLENHRGSSGQILGKKRVLGGTWYKISLKDNLHCKF